MTRKNCLSLCIWYAACTSAPLYGHISIIEQEVDETELSYFLALKGAYEQMSGKNAQAAQTYAQLENIFPKEDHAFALAKMKLAFERGKFEDVAHHNLVLDLAASHDKEIAFIVAQAHLFLHESDAALKILGNLSSRYPHEERFDYFSALAYMKEGKNHQALACINRALSQQTRASKHYLFHFLKAKVALAEGDLESARREAETSFAMNPASAKPLQLLGAIAEKSGAPSNAISFYERYLALAPADLEVANTATSLAIKIHDYEAAQRIVCAYPNNTAKYFHQKALIHMACKQYALAAAAAEKAHTLDPLNAKIQELKERVALLGNRC